MPTYEYTCENCDKPFDIRASIATYTEGLNARCPACGSDQVVRGFSAVNVLTGSQRSTGTSAGCGPSGFS